LPYLDHQAVSKRALSHDQRGRDQDDDPDEERYPSLEEVLPDQQAMHEEAAYRYQVDATRYERIGQERQDKSWHKVSLSPAGQQ
jgi:hypothetical protein